MENKYALLEGGGLIQHVVFEQVSHNFANSTLEVLTFNSEDSARRMLVVWPDAEVIPVKNCLLTASNCDSI